MSLKREPRSLGVATTDVTAELQRVVEALGSDAVALGGSAAGGTVTLAAAVVRIVCRSSLDLWPDASGVAAQAAPLRDRALSLTRQDVAAYGSAAAALSTRGAVPSQTDDAGLGEKLSRAAEVPLRLAETAADVVTLATLATRHARLELRPDAACAAVLAEAAIRACVHLAEVNALSRMEDPQLAEARRILTACTAARDQALERGR